MKFSNFLLLTNSAVTVIQQYRTSTIFPIPPHLFSSAQFAQPYAKQLSIGWTKIVLFTLHLSSVTIDSYIFLQICRRTCVRGQNA